MNGIQVAIAGYRAEGKINYEYWSKLGADITIVDENEAVEDLPAGVATILGEGAFEKLQAFDLVVRTASLNPGKIKTNGKIWSATNEFFAKCPAPIIGVTGTKGKGTTCTLISEILKSADKKVHLVGNIGVPALQELPKITADDIVVFELSSFQLWDLEKSPHIAVWLMMEPDHLNIHASMDDYIDAKFQITAHQTNSDVLIHHPTNPYIAPKVEQSRARKIAYMSPDGAEVKNGEIVIDGQVICRANEVGLIGEHNLENICAAITVSWRYTQDTKLIVQVVQQFKGLPNRLEFVRNVAGKDFINDSFSTGPNSTIAAIKAFQNKKFLLIVGGAEKGVDLTGLIDTIVQYNVRALLIGAVSPKLEALLKVRGYSNYLYMGEEKDIATIVQRAASEPAIEVVLFSPGFTSFDMFKNEFNRGDLFRAAVMAL